MKLIEINNLNKLKIQEKRENDIKKTELRIKEKGKELHLII
jgi:hypothetical protein